MNKMYGVYRARLLILNPKTKADALFKTKREADLLAQSLNQYSAGFYTAVYYDPKYILIRDGLNVSIQMEKGKGIKQ